MGLLSNAPENHPVVFVAKPEPGLSKIIELRADCRNQMSVSGHAVDAGRSDDVGSGGGGCANAIAVVHQQSVRARFGCKHDGLALAGMQAGSLEAVDLRDVRHIRHGKPRSHRRRHRVGYRRIDSTHRDFVMDCSRNDYLREKHAEKVKIAEDSQV